jgi:hypothetical protein
MPPEAPVTFHTVETVELEPTPAHRSFRLTRPSSSGPSVATQVRPAIVLPEREGRALLAAAEREDVSRGGCFSAGPAGVQVWSGPWNGLLGRHGSSEHLGSVDWSYDTPTRHYITVYRVMVTSQGHAAGQTPQSLLDRVLALAGVDAPKDALNLPVPPPRDPFRSDALRQRTSG